MKRVLCAIIACAMLLFLSVNQSSAGGINIDDYENCGIDSMRMPESLDVLYFTTNKNVRLCLSEGKYLAAGTTKEETNFFEIDVEDSMAEISLIPGTYLIARPDK